MIQAICAVVGTLIGLAIGWAIKGHFVRTQQAANQETADAIKRAAEAEGENIRKEAKIAAKEEQIKMREEFERSTGERRKELQQREKQLEEKELNLERKMDLIQNRLDDVTRRDERLAELEKKNRARDEELQQLIAKQATQLEAIASLSRDQARVQLMQRLEEELVNERGTMIRRHLEELRQKCEQEAQKILVQAMQRYAGECAYDRTTTTIPLPSDEMKGRIIGREGRNIRVFEAITGVNVLIDDTPSAVVISCFDPVRREVARLSLERLVSDGRIHPTRVEEVVAKAQQDIESEMVKAGEEACHKLQLPGVAPEVVQTLGRLRYRYSFSQNVLQHSIEVASFMGMIASALNLDVAKAKRMGLFHDIGKALDHEVEGSHAIIGMEYLKRFGEQKEILNGVGCHHGEVPAETPLAALVSVCDALSASRPGARSETTDIYVKRLEQLESIASSFTGVEQCYAVQAGREVRVIVEPSQINENAAFKLSRDIATRIETEMQYPGQIRVCVIRETRSVEYAK
jgi:ribonuclease Y